MQATAGHPPPLSCCQHGLYTPLHVGKVFHGHPSLCFLNASDTIQHCCLRACTETCRLLSRALKYPSGGPSANRPADGKAFDIRERIGLYVLALSLRQRQGNAFPCASASNLEPPVVGLVH